MLDTASQKELDVRLLDRAVLHRLEPVGQQGTERPRHSIAGYQDINVRTVAESYVPVKRFGQRHSLEWDDRHAGVPKALQHSSERADEQRVPRSVQASIEFKLRRALRREGATPEYSQVAGQERRNPVKSRLLDEPRPAKPASQQGARLGLDPWGYRASGEEQETPILGAERRRVCSVHSAPVLRTFVDHSLDRVKDHR